MLLGRKNVRKWSLFVAFIGVTQLVSAQLDMLTRGPYLQKLNPNSVTIKWKTLLPANSKVTYGTSLSNLDQEQIVSLSSFTHTVELSGLAPLTKYYYTIGSTTGVLQGDENNFFLTSPASGTTGKYTFWVTGDCGNNSTNQKNVLSAYNDYMGAKPTNGWITLGDNAYLGGFDVEFTTSFFGIYESTIMKNAPLWPAPGNHDYNNLPLNQLTHEVPYYDIFDLPTNGESGGIPSNNEAYYSYDYGNIHFLSLDSYGIEDLATRLYDTTGRQARWIKEDLLANKLPFVVAYWHHPPYTMASHNSDTEGELVDMRAQFLPFLENLGVDIVMCGHSHGYERSKPMKGHFGMESTFNAALHHTDHSSGMYNGTENSCTYLDDENHQKEGVIYMVSGSAGQLGGSQSTYPHDAMYFSDVTNGGSTVLELEENRLDVKFLCTDGVIRDNYTIIKNSNQVKNIEVLKGQSVVLKASWPGDYIWSTGKTTRGITVSPTANTTYTVRDQQQCVEDVFNVTVVEATGIVEVNAETLVQLFPNPAKSNVSYQVNLLSASSAELQLVDLTGRMLVTINLPAGSIAQGNLAIDQFTKGIYLVKVITDKQVAATHKLIIE